MLRMLRKRQTGVITMANMPATFTSESDILPDVETSRFGLRLDSGDFEALGEELARIGEAERSVEVVAAVLRVY
jgi:hypothetical protein